jgi:hypothetical protein
METRSPLTKGMPSMMGFLGNTNFCHSRGMIHSRVGLSGSSHWCDHGGTLFHCHKQSTETVSGHPQSALQSP